MDLEKAKESFESLVTNVVVEDMPLFISWLKQTYMTDDTTCSTSDVLLKQIRDDIRQSLPLDAIAQSESIQFPSVGENSDCDPATTVHVDAFLYDDDTVDELCSEGKMSRNYCTKCGSLEVKPLTFISHSSSINKLKFMFNYVLPDLHLRSFVDVGSRLGNVLYGAYLYSSAKPIIGIEINKDFCELQKQVVIKYGFKDRIQVLHADVLEHEALIAEADVVSLHNVFEFFMPIDVQEKIWSFLFRTLRKSGSLLISSPSLEESLEHLKIDINLGDWVVKVDLNAKLAKANVDLYGDAASDDSDLGNVHLYTVR